MANLTLSTRRLADASESFSMFAVVVAAIHVTFLGDVESQQVVIYVKIIMCRMVEAAIIVST